MTEFSFWVNYPVSLSVHLHHELYLNRSRLTFKKKNTNANAIYLLPPAVCGNKQICPL